jgi:hypothetical protein
MGSMTMTARDGVACTCVYALPRRWCQRETGGEHLHRSFLGKNQLIGVIGYGWVELATTSIVMTHGQAQNPNTHSLNPLENNLVSRIVPPG